MKTPAKHNESKSSKDSIPNSLTLKTMEKANKGIGLGKPIKNIERFVKSL
jgi:hypothetical protein